ncbi:diguanylate cyclase, partial [Salmonella enterica subsp. enterica]|nr:diguanylate cyclase [Salmonella enterica subsp. enterica serovar Enteritidis]
MLNPPLWSGSPVGVEASGQKTAELAATDSLLSTALRHMSNGLVMVSPTETITLFNDRVRELFGVPPGELHVGMSLHSYLAAVGVRVGWESARVDRVYINHLKWMAGNAITRVEHHFDDGKVLSISCRPMEHGGAILTYDDVTEARQHEKEISRLAYHDDLTGLANRRSFMDRTQKSVLDRTTTVMLIDLDRFKDVNDTFGHDMGDQVLVAVAERMRAIIGRQAEVFRIGGDELALLTDASPHDCQELAASLVAALSQPFELSGERINIGCSIGLARATQGASPSDLVKMADVALYKAKNEGRNRVQFYESGMVEAVAGRLRLEAEMRQAVSEGQFEVYYQPVFRLDDMTLHGFEALLRWNHPRNGLVSPDTFISIAETSGLINPIGAWVIDTVCRQVSRWPRELVVALNVSPVQLRSTAVLAQIVSALDRHGIGPERLEVEMTETALIQNLDEIVAALSGLRTLGIK